MKIEGIPDGWEPVRYDYPNKGESFLNGRGEIILHIYDTPSPRKRLIVRKIEKPKKYRPFANAAEFEPFRDRWFRPKCSPDQCILTTAYNDRGHWTAKEQDTWEDMFDLYTFDDGTPFGIEVTE